MWNKIKNFFIKLIPSKRRIVQVYAALLYNANIRGFVSGKIFEGNSKAICVPGLNCYSCPGAIGACPLGSLQNALYESKTKLPTYIIGIILLYSIILGRTICGYFCPIGLFQELLYKIKTPKLKKNRVTRILSYFKYVLLIVLVIIIPLVYALQDNEFPLPGFCKYICPAGTFEGAILLLSNPSNESFYGMLGSLFTWKFILLIAFIVLAIFIFRFFCRFICPLGAIYGLFNKISILGIKVDKSKCTNCGACVTNCKMDIKEVGDHECIQCGECKKVCKVKAIDWKVLRKIIREEQEQNNVENEVIDNPSKIEPKTRKISKRTFNIITGIVMTAFLIFVIVACNFQKKIFQVNDICDDLVLSTTTNGTFDITYDNNATLLYFKDNLSEEDINELKLYSHQKLNIIVITPKLDDQSLNLSTYNISFVIDSKYQILKKFNEESVNQYTVFMDSSDKILIKKSSINDNDYRSIIQPVLAGNTVGNQVGDICLNKEINLIGSDQIFSVLGNRGKIIVLNFWYKGCGPCEEELPHFNKIYQEYSDKIEVVAIHEASMYHSKSDEVQNHIDTEWSEYTIKFAYDDVNSPYYIELGGKHAWPMTIIVNEEGIIEFIKHGSMSENELREQIELILKGE